ncbi:MAG: glycosyltransferase [Desulfotomaculaceae bacterium]
MRTAEAVKKAALSLSPGAEVVILDTFRYASPFLEKLVLGTYMEMLKMSPVLYGYLYRQAERGQPLSGRGKTEFNRILNILAAPRLVKYINDFKPELIVCTHPFPLGIASYLKKRGTFKGPVFAVITDYTIHSFWIFLEVDYYIVGSEKLVDQCMDYGIAPEQVCPTGIPINPDFGIRHDKNRLKEQMGLEPELPTILLMGGGLGMGPLASSLKALGDSKDCYQLICVAGSNNALQEELNKVAQSLSCRVKVYGFVENIHQLMAASDFMVGKAGGLTCAEAMAQGLPIFIIDPLPGQEERNTEFITAAGAGVRVEAKTLAGLVQSYLDEPRRIEKMADAAAALGKPNAACDAVAFMAKAVEGANGDGSCLA